MLRIHRAERADRLAEALAYVLLQPLADPFTPEVVSVPTRGVERWLTQRLSGWLGAGRPVGAGGDGVCANVEFPFPGRLVGRAVAAAAGVDGGRDPWLPERSTWPLLEAVEDALGEPWLAPLAGHLGRSAPDSELPPAVAPAGAPAGDPDGHRLGRRLSVVRHLADLFDGYGVHRPAMVRAWAAGEDGDGRGGPLPEGTEWQPELWRRLRGRIGTPSPAERLAEACTRLREEPSLLDLPERLALFGLTRLPASYLDVLHAMAAARDVHLFLLHPSPALWAAIDKDPARPRSVVRRREDRSSSVAHHPLLATWGRDAREMQLVLTAGDGFAEEHHPLDVEPTTLLGRIQADVRADRPPAGEPVPGAEDLRAVLDPFDRSLQVHSCHGRARQVEVVRDAVLHLLAEDPTLEPRDVIVMCPDIESFAPLIHATFGLGEHGGEPDGEPADGVAGGPAPVGAPPGGADQDAADQYAADQDAADQYTTPCAARSSACAAAGRSPDLRVRLADRSLRQTNPLLGVVSELLELACARVTASQVVDLASREPVRRRFHLDDDDLARLEEWIAAAGVRWGLDAAHRAPYGLARVEANTWRAGLDRILLGVAVGEEGQRLVGGVLPVDDVDSGDIDLAGRLAELVERLHSSLDALAGPLRLPDWTAAIARAADDLTATSDADAWQRTQLQGLLDDVVEEATVDGTPSDAMLALGEVESLLADRLRGRPTRANFRTGHLTMCTLVPMRSVPHRVVCLLGLDDGVFPRQTAVDGDDLVRRDPYVGDRDPRSEDRQLLLDALLAATDHLVITYTGRDERTNAARPPAVPVGELLDVVDRTACTAGGGRARDLVVTAHPLQPFDLRNFTAGSLTPARPWSFDPVALEGARASTGERLPAPPFLARPLPAAAGDVVQLEDLVRFVHHPVKAFLRQRLGIFVTKDEDDPADGLPVEPDPLQRWAVGQRMLEARLAGADRATCRAAEVARGVLPPGELAGPFLDEIAAVVEEIVAAAPAAGVGGPAESVEVVVELGDGRTLVGTVPDVAGDTVRSVFYSRVAAKHRLAAWVRLLAVTAASPERPFAAMTVGRGSGRNKVAVRRIPPLGPDPGSRRQAALGHLAALVDLHGRGLREPLPLYCKTSAAWAAARARGRDPESAARKEWTSEWDFPKEDVELEHQLVLGGKVALDRLLEARPGDYESGPGWAADEPERLGRLARRLWDPLLACETGSR